MEESRMDRIERDLAEFIQGVRELRESQRESHQKTDEQMRKMGEGLDQMTKNLADLGLRGAFGVQADK